MCECNSRSVMFIITHQNAPKCASSSTWPPPLKNLNSPLILLDDDWHWAIWCSLNNNQRKVSVAQFWRIARCNRHPSGVFSYGNSSITLKMMERSGTFLPGEIYTDLGYVSELFWVVFLLTVYETLSEQVRATLFLILSWSLDCKTNSLSRLTIFNGSPLGDVWKKSNLE